MTELPRPLTRDHDFLAAIASRLDQQNGLLAEIRDRLPSHAGGQPVVGGDARSAEVEITEPATPAGSGEAAPLAEPAAAKKRTPATKTAQKTSTGRTAGSGRTRTTQPKKGT